MAASPTAGSAPLTVAFDGSASSDPDGDPLTYAWDFESNGTVDASGAATSHTYAVDGTYTAKLTVSDGKGGTNSTTTRIDVGNRPPAVTIDTPAAGTLFRVGQGFTLHGSASDPEDGSLPSSVLTWEVERVHATHTHPYLPPTSGNDVPLTAQEPEDLDAAKDSFYRIYLTATDSGGLTTTAVRDLLPHKVNLTFNTSPPGLRIAAGGLNLTGPATVVSWENYDVIVDAPNQADPFGAQWTFESWSDGGAQSHVVNTPATDAGYTATFMSDTQTLTFAPTDDAYVRNDMPTSNFGNSSAVDVDASPVKHALFKFAVSGIAGRSIVSAKLRLFCSNDSSVGGNLHRVPTTTWSEASVNWNTAPAHDPAIIASVGRVAVGNWYEVDLSSAIAGDGVYSFKATSTSSNGAAYTSSEGTAGFRPELRVTVAGTGALDTTPPSAPQSLAAAARSPTQVDLNWTASTDDRGVTAYDVYRNGSFLASATTTSYSDLTVSGGTLYRYEVRARDAAGNVSGPSNEASVTTPTTTPHLFDDDFERGDFSSWTFMSGMTLESQDVLRGLFSARGQSTGQVTYALKQLATPRAELYYRLWFKINDQGGSSTRFARLRTGSGSSGSSIIGFYVSSAGKLGYTNYVASSTSPSTMPVSLFLWHELQVRARVNGTAGEVEVWLDGVRVSDLSKTDNLGTETIGRVQIGDSSSGRTYDVLYDDIAVGTGFID
jgi:PKD repeat protein